MTRQEYKDLLKSDFLRYSDDYSLMNRFRIYLMKPGYAWSYWFRKIQYKSQHKGLGLIYAYTRKKYHNICIKYGYDIPSQIVHIGGGIRIDHFSGIVIHDQTYIGNNVTLRHCTTIGTNGHGIPKIMDNVDIGSNSTILGPITIGENAIIGANTVVLHDVPAGATVVGNPAKIIKQK